MWLKTWLPVVISAVVLLSVEYRSRANRSDPAAVAYFAECRETSELIPFTFDGGWVGTEVPVPTQAEDMLKPNLLVSRNYSKISSRDSAIGLLLVQTSDVNSIRGHYPPVCYPGRGWEMVSQKPGDWTVNGLDIHGTIYTMRPPGSDESDLVHIYNFMIRPDGDTARGMNDIWTQRGGSTGRFYGAGQMQVLFFGSFEDAERDRVFAKAVEACQPTIAAMLDGLPD